jgi:O-Antigen ligase
MSPREAALSEGQNAAVCAPPVVAGANSRGPARAFLYKRPTAVAALLFVSILSGPPRFRVRDAEASLRGDLDWVVILHIAVWALAGLWILWQLGKRYQSGRPLLRLRLTRILGLAMILVLAASSFMSAAPALTAFMVYQMLVSMLFTQIFTERFGLWTSLRAMLWGNALLCAAIAISAVMVPGEVWMPSEFNPHPSRLIGNFIAPTGVVSVLAIILLLTTMRKMARFLPVSMLVCFLTLLVLSLMRTAYIAACVFFALVLLRRPDIKPLRRVAYCLTLVLLLTYASGHFPNINDYRDAGTVSNLGDRIGLWQHLTEVTLKESPWLGLGYYSASRVHGPEYNPGLGTAHSIFIEILTGGGVLSFALLIGLCASLSACAVRLLLTRSDRFSFALSTLFLASLLFGFMGDPLHSGPVAMAFWGTAASLPELHESSMKRQPQIHWGAADATV